MRFRRDHDQLTALCTEQARHIQHLSDQVAQLAHGYGDVVDRLAQLAEKSQENALAQLDGLRELRLIEANAQVEVARAEAAAAGAAVSHRPIAAAPEREPDVDFEAVL